MTEREFCLHGKADAGRPVRHWFDAQDPEAAAKEAERYVLDHRLEFSKLEQYARRRRRGKKEITIIPVPGLE